MTLPSSDSFETYGGTLIDYSQVEDPQTDLSAAQSNPMRASAAALSNTCFRTILSFHITQDGYFTPVTDNYTAVWDITSGINPNPTITYVSPGIYNVSYPSSVYDLTGVSQSLNFLGGLGNPDCVNTTLGYVANIKITSSHAFTVYLCSSVHGDNEDISVSPYTIECFIR